MTRSPLADRGRRDEVRRLLSAGVPMTNIGVRIGISRQAVAKLRDGLTYKADRPRNQTQPKTD